MTSHCEHSHVHVACRKTADPSFDKEKYNERKRVERQMRTLRRNIHAGRKDAVQRMITKLGKASLDKPDQDGWTPFHDACNENATHIVELLLECGCDPSIRNPNDKDMTGWDRAIRNGDVEVFDLLCYEADRADGKIYPTLSEEFKVQRFRRDECLRNRDLIQNKKKPIARASTHTGYGSVK